MSPDLRMLMSAQGHRCAGCGEVMHTDRHTLRSVMRPSVDHVVPQARGGSNALSNKVAMHQRCNGLKADRTPNGCDLLWQAVAQAGLHTAYPYGIVSAKGPRPTLASVWPTA